MWTWTNPEARTWSRDQLLEYIDAAHGLICNAHRARVDNVTEADGASPGWAGAARQWVDAYPPSGPADATPTEAPS